MVLGEYDEDVIEIIASSDELTDLYIDILKEKDVDESDEVIINLALNYLVNELRDNPKNFYKICKECLVMQYLNLHDGNAPINDSNSDDEVLTLNQILNNANSN